MEGTFLHLNFGGLFRTYDFIFLYLIHRPLVYPRLHSADTFNMMSGASMLLRSIINLSSSSLTSVDKSCHLWTLITLLPEKEKKGIKSDVQSELDNRGTDDIVDSNKELKKSQQSEMQTVDDKLVESTEQ